MAGQTTEQRVAALHAEARADYGTTEEREDRAAAAVDQRAGAQSHGNESGGGWRGER
ncbi:hypothetical protein [Kitasatospora aureofaciens]|uniref:hypothetical protein n=1 Tax=Kitasatospora aureofaciens TaxID=1894 RepID=UPI0033D76A69